MYIERIVDSGEGATTIALMAFAAYFMVWTTRFMVPKKKGKGRLMGDARPINNPPTAPG